MDSKFPAIPPELLSALDELFPERSADISWSDREVWLNAGKRAVVRFLHAKFSEQNETISQGAPL